MTRKMQIAPRGLAASAARSAVVYTYVVVVSETDGPDALVKNVMIDQLHQYDDAAMLRTYLAERDVACPLCGYNLRALEGSACPECGHELVLKLDLADPVRGAYLAGLLGLAAALGFNGLFFLFLIVGTLIMGDGPPLALFLYMFAITGVSVAILCRWIRRPSQIRRRPRYSRIRLAVACWLLPLISVAAIFLFMIADA